MVSQSRESQIDKSQQRDSNGFGESEPSKKNMQTKYTVYERERGGSDQIQQKVDGIPEIDIELLNDNTRSWLMQRIKRFRNMLASVYRFANYYIHEWDSNYSAIDVSGEPDLAESLNKFMQRNSKLMMQLVRFYNTMASQSLQHQNFSLRKFSQVMSKIELKQIQIGMGLSKLSQVGSKNRTEKEIHNLVEFIDQVQSNFQYEHKKRRVNKVDLILRAKLRNQFSKKSSQIKQTFSQSTLDFYQDYKKSNHQ